VGACSFPKGGFHFSGSCSSGAQAGRAFLGGITESSATETDGPLHGRFRARVYDPEGCAADLFGRLRDAAMHRIAAHLIRSASIVACLNGTFRAAVDANVLAGNVGGAVG
jgi:hypothetical protein